MRLCGPKIKSSSKIFTSWLVVDQVSQVCPDALLPRCTNHLSGLQLCQVLATSWIERSSLANVRMAEGVEHWKLESPHLSIFWVSKDLKAALF